MNNHLINENVNEFLNLYNCCDNLCICSMGLCFPYCLFGRIYQSANFGSCFNGCCKIFSLHFILNLFYNFIFSYFYWNLLLKEIYINEHNLINCESICNIDNQYIKSINITNDCVISNNTSICNCLKEELTNQCIFKNNKLPNIQNNLENSIIIIYTLYLINLYLINGLFYGYYRTKISQKYNILHNTFYNNWIHCNPFTNQCALCQEYKTIEYIEIYKPITPGFKNYSNLE